MTNPTSLRRRFPDWLKKPLQRGKCYTSVSSYLLQNNLHTVCVEAQPVALLLSRLTTAGLEL